MINTIFMEAAEVLTDAQMESKGRALIGVALGAACAVFAVAYGISKITSKGVESMARQPEVADKIRGAMFFPCTFIEGVGLISVFVCMLAVAMKL